MSDLTKKMTKAETEMQATINALLAEKADTQVQLNSSNEKLAQNAILLEATKASQYELSFNKNMFNFVALAVSKLAIEQASDSVIVSSDIRRLTEALFIQLNKDKTCIKETQFKETLIKMFISISLFNKDIQINRNCSVNNSELLKEYSKAIIERFELKYKTIDFTQFEIVSK